MMAGGIKYHLFSTAPGDVIDLRVLGSLGAWLEGDVTIVSGSGNTDGLSIGLAASREHEGILTSFIFFLLSRCHQAREWHQASGVYASLQVVARQQLDAEEQLAGEGDATLRVAVPQAVLVRR